VWSGLETLWLGDGSEWVFASSCNVGCLRGVCRAGLSTGLVESDILGRNHKPVARNPTPMSKIIHFIGLAVHQETVALSR